MDKMKKSVVIELLSKLSMLCYWVMLVWILYKGYGGAVALVSIAVMVAVGVVIAFSGLVPEEARQKNGTLLLYVLSVFSNLALFRYPDLWPMTSLLTVAGLSGMAYWLLARKYEGKDIRTVLKEELGLPLFFDVVLLGIAIYAGIVGNLTGNPAFLVITVLVLADLIRQVCAFFK